MNIEAEMIKLIDISSEDDNLIDSKLDDTSLDLRLSVANESYGHGLFNKAAKSLLGQEREKICIETDEPKANDVDTRTSLAWDREFFTGAGFLDLEELSLVNEGFKNGEVPFKSQMYKKGKLNGKYGLRGQSFRKDQSLPKSKLASQTLMKSPQVTKGQSSNRRIAKDTAFLTKAVQSNISKQEADLQSLRPRKLRRSYGRIASACSVPLFLRDSVAQLGRTLGSKKPDSRRSTSPSTASSIQSLCSSVATNASTGSSLVSGRPPSETTGGSSIELSSSVYSENQNGGDLKASIANFPHSGTSIGRSPGQHTSLEGLQQSQARDNYSTFREGNATRDRDSKDVVQTSPLLKEINQSTMKPTGLRTPSQKISFFDRDKYGASETRGSPQSHTKGLNSSSIDGAGKSNNPFVKKTYLQESYSENTQPMMNKTLAVSSKHKISREAREMSVAKTSSRSSQGNCKPSVREHRRISQNSHGKRLHAKESGTENGIQFGTKVNELSKYLEGINLQEDTVTDPEGKKGISSPSHTRHLTASTVAGYSSATKSKGLVDGQRTRQPTAQKRSRSPPLCPSVGATVRKTTTPAARHCTLKRRAFF